MEFGSKYILFTSNNDIEKFDEEELYPNSFQFKEKQCYVYILDSFGVDNFHRYMKQVNGIILMYSITDPSSFQKCITIHKEILRIKNDDDIPCVLIGNKIDLEEKRFVSTKEGKELALKIGSELYETSVKSNININEPIHDLCRRCKGNELQFLILGDRDVGKSTYHVQFLQGVFLDNYDPTIYEPCQKLISVTSYVPPKKSGLFSFLLKETNNKNIDFTRTLTLKKASTNCICLQLGLIQDECVKDENKPTKCKNCTSIFNLYSTIKHQDLIWVCEFCNTKNQMSENSKIKSSIIDYVLLEPKIKIENKSSNGNNLNTLDAEKKMIENPVIANNVSLSLIFHKECHINKKNKIHAKIGNVTSEHDVTLEFQTEKNTSLNEMSFQAQITYTKEDGSQYLRIITVKKPITTDVDLSEKESNFSILGTFSIQESSKLALTKNFENALLNLLVYKRLMKRVNKNNSQVEEYVNFLQESRELKDQLMKSYSKTINENYDSIKLFQENKLFLRKKLMVKFRENYFFKLFENSNLKDRISSLNNITFYFQ